MQNCRRSRRIIDSIIGLDPACLGSRGGLIRPAADAQHHRFHKVGLLPQATSKSRLRTGCAAKATRRVGGKVVHSRKHFPINGDIAFVGIW